MNPLPFTGLDPVSVTNCVASYSTIFTDYAGGIHGFGAFPLNRPYIDMELPSANPAALLGGGYILQPLKLPSIDSGFGPVRGIGFQYRPWYRHGFNLDYYTGSHSVLNGDAMALYTPTVVVFNNTTLESVFIRPQMLGPTTITIAAATKSYQPLSINVQGRTQFFCDLTDNVELCVYSPTDYNNFGKLILNLYNFDVHTSFQTGYDAMYPIT